MKDLIDVLHKIGLIPIYMAGWFTVGMLGLSLVPSLSYIPKVFMLYILTPFVMGR